MINIMTIDLEDWYQTNSAASIIPKECWDSCEGHLDKTTDKILDIFSGAGIKATFFVLAYSAQRYPHLIRAIKKEGHEIALHGLRHTLVFEQNPDSFKRDLTEAKKIVEDISGNRLLGYRAPNWSINYASKWAINILEDAGFQYDSSLPYEGCVKNIDNILEIPRSSVLFLGKNVPFGGGVLLRILPYKLTRKLINYLNSRNTRFTTYFHPWEFGAQIPKFHFWQFRENLQYSRMGSTETKLKVLLKDFEFSSIKNIYFT